MSWKFFIICVVLFCSQLTYGKSQNISTATQCSNQQYRPKFHFSPAQHWINDPNGMVYYYGVYHLFYQYHPYSSVWGPMHWGHAISKNLVNWEELDIALYPDEIGTIFSGSAVVDTANTSGFKNSSEDPIVAIYTSTTGNNNQIQRQSLAYSNDKGMTFTKYSQNPVLADPNSPDFRDPKVFYHVDKWVMSLAVQNRIEFYGSRNLKDWNKLSEFGADPPQGNHDGVWECPDLINIPVNTSDGKVKQLWILLVSINPGGPNKGSATQYFIGEFDGKTFTSYPWKNTQWLDWGTDNYAGVTFANEPKGRHVLIGWMNNWLYANVVPTPTWRGQMTIPRTLGIRVLNETANDYRLTSAPVEELVALRHPFQSIESKSEFTLSPQSVVQLTNHTQFVNPLMELEIVLEISGMPQVSICAYNDNDEEICFGYNTTRLYLDRTKTGNTGFSQEYASTLYSSAVREVTDQQATIRMFLDVSSMEVFTDDGLAAMTSLYFSTAPIDKIYVNNWSPSGSGNAVKVKSFKIWGLLCW